MIKSLISKTILMLLFAVIFFPKFGLSQNWSDNLATGTACGVAPNTFSVFGTSAASVAPWQDIHFYSLGVERMRLVGTAGPSLGFLGISPAGGAFVPGYALDVNGGDININTQGNGLRINGSYVITYNLAPPATQRITNIYVGVGAGNTTTTAVYNTFSGYDAGNGNTVGDSNVFNGSQAGMTNAGGLSNTYVGALSGSASAGTHNTFVGYSSGKHTLGLLNTFVGWTAGQYNTTGASNTAIGSEAFSSNLTGNWNTITGYAAGYNIDANANCFYGKHCGYTDVSGSGNCFFGAHSGFFLVSKDSNCFYGTFSGLNQLGSGNIIIGHSAGINNSILFNTTAFNYTSYDNSIIGANAANLNTGNDNIILGAFADIYQTTLITNISNSGAIGYKTLAVNNNQFILGNNNQLVGIGLSADVTGPQANLEICTQNNLAAPAGPYPNANGFLGYGPATGAGSSNPYSGTGFSGLKFRNLTAFSSPVQQSSFGGANPYPTGVLSVDKYGNVIYIPAPTGSGTGAGSCSSPTSLSADAAINLNNNNYYFESNGSGSLNNNNVAIGKSCTTPIAKLDVLQASNAPFLPSQSSIGIYVENDDLSLASGSTIGAPVIGIKSYVPNPNNLCQSVAGWFEAPGTGSPICPPGYAVIVPPNGGSSGFGTTNPSGTLEVDGGLINLGTTTVIGPIQPFQAFSNQVYINNQAIVGTAYNGTAFNIGVVGQANATATLNDYGVYGTIIGTPGANDYAGFFNGNTQCGATFFASDSILKDSVQPLKNPLGTVLSLQPKSYIFNRNHPQVNLNAGKQYGFIAQNIQKILPTLVDSAHIPSHLDSLGHPTSSPFGYLALNYVELIPFLAGAIQQQQGIITRDSLRTMTQQTTIDSLRTVLNSIQACLAKLCDSSMSPKMLPKSNNNGQDVTLSNSAILYQNAPNPFGTGGTKISYFLPEGTTGAVLMFLDSYGTKIKEVQLTQTGMGTININPSQLTDGIYTYSLIINGIMIDTKKMVYSK